MKKSSFNSLSEWYNSSKKAYSAYNAAVRQGLIPRICKEFGWELPKNKKKNGYWNLERCKEDALKYKTPAEWQKKGKSSYGHAFKNKILHLCNQHMSIRKARQSNFWNYENCIIEALKYKTIKEWRTNSKSSYNSANRNNWREDCSKHMIKSRLPKLFWTFEMCKEDGLKYNARYEWQKKSRAAYTAALKNGWLDDCCEHMINIRIINKTM